MKALLSIKPEFVERIMVGEKLYEYRKVMFKQEVDAVLIYCTKPVGKIIGEFRIGTVVSGCPKMVWSKTKHGAGITKSRFDEYFKDRGNCFALEITNKTIYAEPFDPFLEISSFSAPQSFHYVSTDSALSLRVSHCS